MMAIGFRRFRRSDSARQRGALQEHFLVYVLPGYRRVTVMGAPLWMVDLRKSIILEGSLGIRRTVSRLGIATDQSDFGDLLRARIAVQFIPLAPDRVTGPLPITPEVSKSTRRHRAVDCLDKLLCR
jgi:hypothetical protein